MALNIVVNKSIIYKSYHFIGLYNLFIDLFKILSRILFVGLVMLLTKGYFWVSVSQSVIYKYVFFLNLNWDSPANYKTVLSSFRYNFFLVFDAIVFVIITVVECVQNAVKFVFINLYIFS